MTGSGGGYCPYGDMCGGGGRWDPMPGVGGCCPYGGYDDGGAGEVAGGGGEVVL